jgi:hypothetical protein
MKAVHITPTRNVPSIIANGIHRSPPILHQYNDVMVRDYDDYDPEKGLVFCFVLDDYEEKWFQHFAYWKVWGNPRNIVLGGVIDVWDHDRFYNSNPSIFKGIIPAAEHLTALVIDIPDHDLYGWYLHAQSHAMQKHWHDMEEKYEHNDKPLVLINYDVPPSAIKYSIGCAETNLSKSGKVDIIMSMKRKSL